MAVLADVATRRLILHPFVLEEAERVVRRAPAPTSNWDADYPMQDEVDILRAFVAEVRAGMDHGAFTVYEVRTRARSLSIGGIGFFGPPTADGVVEVGYGLVPGFRRHGFATEALTAMVGIAARESAVRIMATTVISNVAAQRVLVRAGFTEHERDGVIVGYRRDLQ